MIAPRRHTSLVDPSPSTRPAGVSAAASRAGNPACSVRAPRRRDPGATCALMVLALLISAPRAATQSTLLSYEGGFHGAEFGTTVALCDVDGDSWPDLLVGCPEDDTVGEDAGAVYLFDGSDGSLLRVHHGAAAGDRFGSALSDIADVNQDGVRDYVVGAPFSDVNSTDSGRVTFYSGATGASISSYGGAAAGDRFGAALAPAGSVPGLLPGFPAVPMLAIGAPYADGAGGTDSGAVFFRSVSGQAAPWPPSEKRGIEAFEHYGATLDAQWSELVVGAPDYDGAAGANIGRIEAWELLDVVLSSDPFAVTKFSVAGDAAGGRLGAAVTIAYWASAPGNPPNVVYVGGAPDATTPYVKLWVDVSGTGTQVGKLTGSGRFGAALASGCKQHCFLAVGAPEYVLGGTAKGRVSLYADGALFGLLAGTASGERFGAALAGQLGHPDTSKTGHLLVGAPLADIATTDDGRVALYQETTLRYGVNGVPSQGDFAGAAVAGLGDVNGDGVPDVLVGSPDADATASFPLPGERIGCGSARVISGATGAVLRSHFGGADGDHLGASVAALGDVNLDGVTDYVIGAPQNDNTTTTAGYAVVASGATGSTLFTLTGVFNSGHFGAAVGGGSDVNGDGRPDVLVGSPDTSNGNVTAYSGVNGASLGTVNGATAGDHFGAAVAGLGVDLDGDGKQEYLVGAPGYDFLGTVDAGRAYLLKSTTSLLTINVANGFAAGDEAGTSVAAAGDVNHDGVSDYLVGIPGYDGAGSNSGRVRAISGVAGIGTQLATLSGLGSNDRFGTSVTGLGDVDGDGWVDWAGGAREQDPLFGGNGYVRVLSGKDQSQLFLIAGSGLEGLGVSVAAAGDVDLDGVRDVVAGGPYNDAHGTNSGVARVYSLSSGLPVWTDLGFALPGLTGAPSLVGTGSLLTGSPGALSLSAAAPAALCALFGSLTQGAVPFKGGTLVPVPVDLVVMLGTSPTGDIPITWGAWQAGLSGLELHFQYAIQDAGGPKGAALSNAVRASVP